MNLKAEKYNKKTMKDLKISVKMFQSVLEIVYRSGGTSLRI